MELALLTSALAPGSAQHGLELPPAIARLVEAVERSLNAENSRRAYRTSLLHFISWCQSQPTVTAFSRLTVLQFKDAVISAGETFPDGSFRRRFSPATVNQRLAAVRALAQEAADQGLLPLIEAAGIARVRGEKDQGRRMGMWIGKEELDRILLSPDRTTLRVKRDYAMLAILFSAGLRRSELVSLPVAAVRQQDGQWGLIDLKGKGSKVRSIPLPLWVKDAIFEWLGATKIVYGYLFRSISRHGRLGIDHMSSESVKLILSHYAREQNLASFRPHDARRSCARLCRAAHASLEDIQELLGHSSIQTTERYLGRSDGFKRAITNAIAAPDHAV